MYSRDRGGFWWGLLGFVIPLVGLVLFLAWQDTKPRCSRAAGTGALINVLLVIIVGFVSGLFFFGAIAKYMPNIT